jgi:hypothetical protein
LRIIVIADRDWVSGKPKNSYNAYWSHYGILFSREHEKLVAQYYTSVRCDLDSNGVTRLNEGFGTRSVVEAS